MRNSLDAELEKLLNKPEADEPSRFDYLRESQVRMPGDAYFAAMQARIWNQYAQSHGSQKSVVNRLRSLLSSTPNSWRLILSSASLFVISFAVGVISAGNWLQRSIPKHVALSDQGTTLRVVNVSENLQIATRSSGNLSYVQDNSSVTFFGENFECFFDLKPNSGTRLLIKTPNSELYVTGTKFIVSSNRGKTRLAVVSGTVHISDGLTSHAVSGGQMMHSGELFGNRMPLTNKQSEFLARFLDSGIPNEKLRDFAEITDEKQRASLTRKTVSISLNDGSEFVGTILRETPEFVEVETKNFSRIKVTRRNIAQIIPVAR